MASNKRKRSTNTTNKQDKSLSSYLKYLEGMELTVELKNGRQSTGILVEAEAATMNLILQDATTNRQTHIRGCAVRYITFPNDMNVVDTIRVGQERERNARQKYRRGLRK